jgi:D-tyrosyl-tRNA(Tyr) deacylase
MRAILQRVSEASVRVDGELIGQCGRGLMILLGVEKGDTQEDAQLLAAKILKLRIFEDENGKMNRSVQDVDGEALVISQFTLLANYRHGNRPDYLDSAPPAEANALYEDFRDRMAQGLRQVGCGRFGADMKVALVNDGPVTIVMDSRVLRGKEGDRT